VLGPQACENQHDADRDPEPGIELDLSAVGQLAAKNGFPLVPVKKNTKRIQALEQAKGRRQVKQKHQDPAENAKFSGRFRKPGSVKRARWIAHQGRRQEANAGARRDDRGRDKRYRADKGHNAKCGQRIHASVLGDSASSEMGGATRSNCAKSEYISRRRCDGIAPRNSALSVPII